VYTEGQKAQISDWLRQADKCIREGRYIAADEALQRVFHIQPENTTALTYQDRIQFLINQLSHRFGLRDEIQTEVRKYRDLMLQRKSNQINTFLVSARKYLDEGYFKRASEQVSKVLSIDSGNAYAKELHLRLTELLNDPHEGVSTGGEYKLRSLLRESWTNGTPSAAQQEIITNVQATLKLSDATRAELEREVRNMFYKDGLREIWVNGGLAAFTPEAIDELRAKFEVTRVDHASIETTLLREVRKNRIRGTILVVDGDDALLNELTRTLRLNSYAVAAAISPEEAIETMKLTVPDIVISEVTFDGGLVGFDLYQAIRSTNGLAHIPFFFMSKTVDRTSEIIGRRLGVDGFVPKPIDYEMLLATLIGRLLNRHEKKNHPAK